MAIALHWILLRGCNRSLCYDPNNNQGDVAYKKTPEKINSLQTDTQDRL